MCRCRAHRKSSNHLWSKGYWHLNPGSGRVGMMLQNLSSWEVRIPPKTIIGNVQAKNLVTNMLAPRYVDEASPAIPEIETT